MEVSLKTDFYDRTKKKLSDLGTVLEQHYPQYNPQYSCPRQPVHTLYGGAQLWKYNATNKIAQLAKQSFLDYAPNPQAFADILQLPADDELLTKVHQRILQKLESEAIEDFRIDFEDGYGIRKDEEEDHHAEFCALETAKGMKEKTLPEFLGIRIKPFSRELHQRSIRTLDIFLSTLLKATQNTLPSNFVITLPKAMLKQQVEEFTSVLDQLESALHLPKMALQTELMIETPQSVLNYLGQNTIPSLLEASHQRCRGLHYGTYDYTALCDITAQNQHMMNPVCDFAKYMMQVGSLGTGVWLSDGATNIMPTLHHRGESLTPSQIAENKEAMGAAWRISFKHIMHSLVSGFYQGWDLHPAQIPIRYAAVYYFFLKGLNESANRLNNFISKAAQATLLGDVFDDAATGQGLLNYFLRAYSCKAITESELAKAGLSLAELNTRSFGKIIASRTGK